MGALQLATALVRQLLKSRAALLAENLALPVGSRAGAVVRKVVVLAVSQVSPFVPV